MCLNTKLYSLYCETLFAFPCVVKFKCGIVFSTFMAGLNEKMTSEANVRAAASRLDVRKGPKQERSQRMVENILESTRELLKESRGTASKKITTTQIARRAGISVGSLYQYFPSTESILSELFKQITMHTRQVLEDFSQEKWLSLPRDEFVIALNRAVLGVESNADLTLDIINCTRIYPALAEAEKDYANYCAGKLAQFMKHYGSTWPMAKLKRLGLHVFYVNFGTYIYREHAQPPRKEALEWEVNVLSFMLNQCFE